MKHITKKFQFLAAASFFLSPLPALAWAISFPATPMSALEWMKANKFEEQKGSAAQWRIEDSSLVMIQDKDSTTIATKHGFPLKVESNLTAEFEIKVEQIPEKADLQKKEKEDAAFRFLILFDKGGGVFTPPDTLGYAWASQGKVGDIITADRFKNVKYLVIAAGTTELNQWKTFKRNVAADYKKAFGATEVPKIGAIALKSDGNDTKGKAKARVKILKIELSK